MTRRRKISFVLLAIVVLVCAGLWWLSTRPRMMSADINSSNGAHYTMLLPNDLTPAHINDSAASLQYENTKRGLYVIVIDESKAKIISFGLDYDLDTYMKIATRALDNDGVYVNNPTTINGNKAFQTEIKGGVKNEQMIYKLTCIETPKYFYQVLIWSPSSTYEKNKSDIDKIIYSFKEAEK